MAWPQSILGLYVEMNVGGTWTDITTDVYGGGRGNIQITRGAANESTTLEPGRASMTLNNLNGKYSPRNPLSPYYGLIGRNTPVRIWAPGPTAHMLIDQDTESAVTANNAALNITTDIDLRIELALDTIPAQDPTTFAGQSQTIFGRYNTSGNQRSWRILIDPYGQPTYTWSTNGTNNFEVVALKQLPYSPGQRFALRVTHDVDNGAAGNTVTFYTSDLIGGTWTQLGDPIITAGTTSIFNAATQVSIGDVINQTAFIGGNGRYYKAEVRNGIGGTAVANPDFTAQADGTTSFTDASGRLWTFSGSPVITHRHQRFYGEVAEWPMEWEVGGFDVWTTIQANGILRRLGQGAKPIQSALRRRIENLEPLPVAYWPLEDGVNSDAGGSGLDGVINLATQGFQFATTTDQLGSKPVVTLSATSKMNGTTFNAVAGNWQYEFIYKLDALPSTSQLFCRFQMQGGTVDHVDVHISTASIITRAYDADDALLFTITNNNVNALALFIGQWNRFRLYSVDNYPTAADCTIVGAWEEVESGLMWVNWDDFVGTPGAPFGISSTWGSAFEGMGLGHIAIWDGNLPAPSDPVTDQFEGYSAKGFEGADHGFAGEYVDERIARLAEETHTRMVIIGTPNTTTQLGPQSADSLLNNIQSIVETDMGRLTELRHVPSLNYRPRVSLYNQPSTMELDYEVSGEIVMPFSPVDDDQMIRNDVTVTRDGGAEARSFQTTGPLSTQDPPDGVGTYDESVTLNLYDDDQPKQWADWRLHLGTWDAARYPTISFDLRVATQKTEEWLNFEVGDIFTIVNPPAWMPPDDILLRMEGYTETLHQYGWDVTMNCSPAAPFRVGVVGDTILGHLDTAACELAEALDTTETGVDVTTTDGPLWTTVSANFPFTVRVGGEVMTVTSISSTTNPQTMTVVRSVNGVVKSHAIGAAISLDEPARVVLG